MGATGFSEECHTREAICKKTVAALHFVGLHLHEQFHAAKKQLPRT